MDILDRSVRYNTSQKLCLYAPWRTWHTVDFSINSQQFTIAAELLARGNRHAQFPVRFAVKLVGTDETRPRTIRGPQEHKICRNSLVLLQYDKVANAKTRGRHRARVGDACW